MTEVHVVSGVSTDWIIGWKVACVAVTPDLQTIRFRSVVMGGESYAADAEAQCFLYKERHAAPADMCRCGFNSWHESQIALHYLRFYQFVQSGVSYRYGPNYIRDFTKSIVLLRVGLCGDVVEGTLDAGRGWEQWGYRASRQLVTDVYFDTKCCVCGQYADRLGAVGKVSVRDEVLVPLVTFCSWHAKGQRILQKERLSIQNDIDIHWGIPSE